MLEQADRDSCTHSLHSSPLFSSLSWNTEIVKMKNEKWKMKNEKWNMKYEIWKMKHQKRKMKNGKWKVETENRQTRSDKWNMKHEIWNMKYEKFWFDSNICSYPLCRCSFRLTGCCFDLQSKTLHVCFHGVYSSSYISIPLFFIQRKLKERIFEEIKHLQHLVIGFAHCWRRPRKRTTLHKFQIIQFILHSIPRFVCRRYKSQYGTFQIVSLSVS